MDTIDIEDFAEYVKSSFVTYFTELALTELAIVAPWTKLPVLSWLIRQFVNWVVDYLATKGGQVAFMINTKVFTQDQAKDYMSALEAMHSLPDTVTDEQWEKAENEANHAFRNLINFAM